MGDDNNIMDLIDPDSHHYDQYSVNFTSHTLDNFVRNSNLNDNCLNIIHHNARSIMKENRLSEYDMFFKSINNPFKILVFTETWLTNNNVDLCKFHDYSSVHLLRPIDQSIDFKEKGGGISIFVHNNIQYNHRSDLDVILPFMECCFIEIIFNDKKYMIAGIYRIPNTDINLFIDKLNEIIEPLKSSSELILLGDFNINLLNNDSNKNSFELCLQSNYLVPTILAPTRVATKTLQNGLQVTTETLIDNIIIKPNTNHHSGLIESTITDHYPVYISIPEFKIDTNDSKIIKYRLISENSKRKFKNALNRSIININQHDSAREVFTNFNQTFNKLYDKYFPILTKTTSHKDEVKPWISDILINQMKIRDKLYKLASKKRIDIQIYKNFRNLLTYHIRRAKAKYYEDEFNKTSSNIKKTWSTINSVIRKNKQKSKINLIDENGTKVHDTNVSTKFVDYFTNIATNLTNQLPDSQTNPSQYLRNRNMNSFVFLPTNAIEIEDIIKDLKDNGAGLKIISNSVLKYSNSEISPLLSEIINKCINQGYFPQELKCGCITPIYKNGEKTSVKNYRPVCSLSSFSKIIEKVVYNRMMAFIDKHEILSSKQFGFRKKMGTETALAYYIDYLLSGLKDEKYTISIFMDLSKAFDVLNHNILKTKLEHYGFRSNFLNFIMNFIENREYFVSANGHISHTRTVNIGVPQGSTLGPLLFLLYINDMVNCSNVLNFSLFADDSTASHSDSDLNTALDTLKDEFTKVLEWLSANKLIINLQKTHLMLFTNRARPASISLNIDDSIITEQTETKFLGIIVDNQLNWKAHIKHITNKVSKSVAILRLLRYIFPKNILKTLYQSLTYPYFNYCNLIWGTACPTNLKPLVLLQKKCICIICGADYLDHTDPLFEITKVLKLEQIHILSCAKFIYNCYKLDIYTYFRARLVLNSQIHHYNTRISSNLRAPFERLESGINSFFVKGINIWNELPHNIKSANSITYFKTNLKKWLLDKSSTT